MTTKKNNLLNEGMFTVAIPPADSRQFALFKGEVLLGLIVDHPCGQWAFSPAGDVVFVLDTLGAVCKCIMEAEKIFKDAQAHAESGDAQGKLFGETP